MAIARAAALVRAVYDLLARRPPQPTLPQVLDPDDPSNWVGLDFVFDQVRAQLNQQEKLWEDFSGHVSIQDPQLAQVNAARNNRAIDALIIQIGGNDIGFTPIITECITQGIQSRNTCGSSRGQAQLFRDVGFANRLNLLKQNLDFLAACVGAIPEAGLPPCISSERALDVRPDHVFLLGYPDPARGDMGTFCGDSTSILGPDAWDFTENQIVSPLNAVLGAKAQQYGWSTVPLGNFNLPPADNPLGSFLVHGYCATDTWLRPFLNADGNSSADQRLGTFSIQGDSSGAFHPNRAGQERMERALETAIDAKIY